MAITTIKGAGKIPAVYRNTALTNSAVQVASVPVILKGINVINPNAGLSAHAFLKFYNATSATVGTTAIVKTILCEQNAATFISAEEIGLEEVQEDGRDGTTTERSGGIEWSTKLRWITERRE